MGEINKVLSEGLIGDDIELAIELNHPASEMSKETVHIQSQSFRYELTLKEFRLLSSAILGAESTLGDYKTK